MMEYKVVWLAIARPEPEIGLNEYAAHGWRVVAVIPSEHGGYPPGNSVGFVLERERTEK